MQDLKRKPRFLASSRSREREGLGSIERSSGCSIWLLKFRFLTLTLSIKWSNWQHKSAHSPLRRIGSLDSVSPSHSANFAHAHGVFHGDRMQPG